MTQDTQTTTSDASADHKETTDQWDDTLLRNGAIQQRMKCGGSMAANIEETFVTVEQLVDAINADDPLTDRRGVGPKTAEVIHDWYENREEREKHAQNATVERTSGSSFSISFLGSWADALGIEVEDDE